MPIMYELIDHENKMLPRRYYEKELQLVKHPNVYLVKEILKKKGDKLLVSWVGDKYKDIKTWIHKKDLINAEK